MTMDEIKLNYKTDDVISSIMFGPQTNQYLLITSWDGTVTLHDVNSNKFLRKYAHDRPVLDGCFQDAVHTFSGGLDYTLKMYDFNCNSERIIGTHNNAIKCIAYSPEWNCVLSGGWDSRVKLWDPRSAQCAGNFIQPDKVFTLSLCGEKFIVGTAERKVYIWDLRNMGYIDQRRDSSLKYQTRCIRAFPNKQGYVLSSIEGRVAVEFLDPRPEVQKKKFAFKCHRISETGIEKIYPVNAISFHQGYNTFATGGSDCFVNIWDGFNKKRLCQFRKYPTAVTSLSFSFDGGVLAVGCSNLFDESNPQNVPDPKSAVFIRYVSDQETKPK